MKLVETGVMPWGDKYDWTVGVGICIERDIVPGVTTNAVDISLDPQQPNPLFQINIVYYDEPKEWGMREEEAIHELARKYYAIEADTINRIISITEEHKRQFAEEFVLAEKAKGSPEVSLWELCKDVSSRIVGLILEEADPITEADREFLTGEVSPVLELVEGIVTDYIEEVNNLDLKGVKHHD